MVYLGRDFLNGSVISIAEIVTAKLSGLSEVDLYCRYSSCKRESETHDLDSKDKT